MSQNHRLDEAIKNGIKIPKNGYWGNVPSRICGQYGGAEEGYKAGNRVEYLNVSSKEVKISSKQ